MTFDLIHMVSGFYTKIGNATPYPNGLLPFKQEIAVTIE